MSKRQPRFERAVRPACALLTPRDLEVILTCWSYRWLTRAQLQALVPLPGVGRTNERLRKLFDRQLLSRTRAATVGCGLQPVYSAGDAAVPLIAAETGLAECTIRARLRDDVRASAILLPHDLEVNDCRISLVSAAAHCEGVELDAWLTAQECFDAYAEGRVLRPDGYFRLRYQGVVHSFYLELDRGTTPIASRWTRKVERYLEYRDGGRYQARYGLQRFRVLTLTTTEARLRSLIAATGCLARRSFWFSLTGQLLAEPDLFRPIWRPVGSPNLRSLLQVEGDPL